jgi:hypothetical protein
MQELLREQRREQKKAAWLDAEAAATVDGDRPLPLLGEILYLKFEFVSKNSNAPPILDRFLWAVSERASRKCMSTEAVLNSLFIEFDTSRVDANLSRLEFVAMLRDGLQVRAALHRGKHVFVGRIGSFLVFVSVFLFASHFLGSFGLLFYSCYFFMFCVFLCCFRRSSVLTIKLTGFLKPSTSTTMAVFQHTK